MSFRSLPAAVAATAVDVCCQLNLQFNLSKTPHGDTPPPPFLWVSLVGAFLSRFGHIRAANLVPAELHVGSIFVYNFGPFGLIFDVFFAFRMKFGLISVAFRESYFERLWGCFGGVWSSVLEAWGCPKI